MTLLPGDGVGPELMQHVKGVFRYSICNNKMNAYEIQLRYVCNIAT